MTVEEGPTAQLTTVKARHLLALFFVVLVGLYIVWPSNEAEIVEAVISCASYLLLLTMILLHCRSNGTDLQGILGPYPSANEALGLILLAVPLIGLSVAGLYAVYLPLSWIKPEWVIAILDMPNLCEWETSLDELVSCALNSTTTIILAPIVEEIVFRGFLLNRWWQKYGLKKAIITSSIVFGIVHIEFLGGTLFGVILCMLYVRSRSLIGPILVHISNNTIVFMVEIVERFMTGESQVFSLAEFRDYWWLAPIGLAVGVPWLRGFYMRHLVVALTPST